MNWTDLNYWVHGEWDVVRERLQEMELEKQLFSPAFGCLFRSMDLTPFDKVKVCFLGQDPYPNSQLSTGLAFEVYGKTIPLSLQTLLKEYSNDLKLPMPTTGRLSSWATSGVFLWNCYPSCAAGKSLSHAWPEWELLTKEVLESLNTKTGMIFVAFGSVAQRMAKRYIDHDKSAVMYLSHPSPRGQARGRWPVAGTRLFSTLNTMLTYQNIAPINWRLQCPPSVVSTKSKPKLKVLHTLETTLVPSLILTE